MTSQEKPQEDPQQPYECQPSGGQYQILRMAMERPGRVLRHITSMRSRSQADRVTSALNTAWYEGRVYERKHPGE